MSCGRAKINLNFTNETCSVMENVLIKIRKKNRFKKVIQILVTLYLSKKND